MLKTFDLDVLRTFVAVVEHGTFEKAARAIDRTQAAVSQQMQRLEAQIELPLFVRAGRTKRVSPDGLKLLPYARELVNLNDDAARALSNTGARGSLRIGSPQDVADTLLPPILRTIARAAPELRLEIIVSRSHPLMEGLRQGKIDMTISNRLDASLQGVVLHTAPTGWICSAQYVHSMAHPLPLVLTEEPSLYRRIAIETLDFHRIPWRQAYVSSNLIATRAAISANLGISARSTDMLGRDVRVLGSKDGMPALPDVAYYLWIRPHAANSVAREIFELLNRGQPYKNPPLPLPRSQQEAAADREPL